MTQPASMKISENTEIKLDLKTVIKLVIGTALFVGLYYTLQSEIEDAQYQHALQQKHIDVLERQVHNLEVLTRELDKELHLKPKIQ